MLIRIPVASREITWLDRPYDMNGSVSPVVGIRPSDTAMCMNAVSPMAAVSPDGEILPERIGRGLGDAKAEPAEQREERDDDDTRRGIPTPRRWC